MGILTTVYGDVDIDGNATANGEEWWIDYQTGVFAGAFCSQRISTGIYQVMFAAGSFPEDQEPALVVTGTAVTGESVRSARIQWSELEGEVENPDGSTTPIKYALATIYFKNYKNNPKDTSFSFVAAGLLGESLPMTVPVEWVDGDPDASPPTLPSLDIGDIECDHPMTLVWKPVNSNGDVTTSFYITAIMGLPSSVFGVPQGQQRTSIDNNLGTALSWEAFNNCPDDTEYQYTICAVKGDQVVCADPKIKNISQ